MKAILRKQIQLVHRFALALVILCMAIMPPNRSAQASPQAQNDNPIIQKYRQLIPQLMAEQDIPGLAVAVADDTGVLWAEGFGFTDNDRKTPVTPDTIFSVQSISKNFTAAAVLLAVQEGLLDLDTPITTYLPDFTVHSIFEEHPERKITLRMLLSHTAGFTMEAPVGNNFDLGSVSFEDHVKTISDTWLRFPVGTGFAYSNVGISLAGYVLQKVSGMPFAQYVEEKLLHPVGMVNSSFDMAQIRVNPNRAIGHSGSMPKVPLEIPLIPEGGLYTSANDMAKYIQFHLNRGSVNGQSLLNPALLDEMYTGGLAVGHEHWHQNRETDLFFHGGGGFGFLADLYWCPELKIGITVLTNSADHQLQGYLAVQILDDFIHDPNSVSYSRLMALPNRAYVSDSQKGLPLDLAQTIEQHAPQTLDQDRLRWEKYVGAYSTTNWGNLNP